MSNIPMLTDASIIITYRCHMQCKMCNIWQNPSDKSKEITSHDLNILPNGFEFINLTGGEPFLRDDLEEIIRILKPKTKRIVISTSGWHSDKILRIVPRFKNVGIRVSIEGLSQKNDKLRGRSGGFDRGLTTLLGLQQLGVKDIGFGITVSDNNSEDMLWLYELSRSMHLEFATAAFHNSFYFHKKDNLISNIDKVCADFQELARRQMYEKSPKSWFRALFNLGLVRYVRQKPRMLPCQAGTMNFFIDPYGEIYPCNGMEQNHWLDSMGNIRSATSFQELWYSEQAERVRNYVSSCDKNCWMIGTASPVMHKYKHIIIPWVLRNKIKSLLGHDIDHEAPLFNVGPNANPCNLKIN